MPSGLGEFHPEHRVTGGGHPPPVPTERGVRTSRTTVLGSRFTAPRVPASPGTGGAVWFAAADLRVAMRARAESDSQTETAVRDLLVRRQSRGPRNVHLMAHRWRQMADFGS